VLELREISSPGFREAYITRKVKVVLQNCGTLQRAVKIAKQLSDRGGAVISENVVEIPDSKIETELEMCRGSFIDDSQVVEISKERRILHAIITIVTLVVIGCIVWAVAK
jgi:hypothetical protein